jgi:GPH family glycoside/pentoside/hexuronide:cation symporter
LTSEGPGETIVSDARRLAPQELSTSAMMGWAAGGHGTSVMIGVLTLFLLNYLTDSLGIEILLASQIIFFVRLYDLATDPIMGLVSDRSQSRMGRRRPYLLVGAVVCFIAFVMLFNVPEFVSSSSAAIYAAGALVLYSTAYTIFNVPHLAMPAEMTSDYHARTRLMSYRLIFVVTSILVLSVGGGQILSKLGEAQGYPVFGWSIGATVLLAMIAAFYFTKGAHFSERTLITEYSIRQQALLIWQNRHFRIFLLAKFCLLMAQASFTVAFLFFAKYALGRGPELLITFGVYQLLGTAIAMPVWPYISKRLGKRIALMVAAVSYAAAMLTWLLASPDEADFILGARVLVIGFCSGGIIILGFAILPDTIEFDRSKNGINREGVYSGIYSSMEKAASAVGPLMFGAYLAANGYASSVAGEQAVQPDAAVQAIYIGIGVFPAIATLSAAFVMLFYTLDEDTLKSLRGEPVG